MSEMMNMEKLMKMSAEELEVINGLIPVAKEAAEAAEIIRKTYRFAIGEESIVVWSDEYNKELLTHAGVWQARYLHQTYDVQCTKEEIFRHYKAMWLIDKGYMPMKNFHGALTEEAHLREVCRYFKSFVQRTKARIKVETPADEFESLG